jgi:hypothetical protein
MKKIVRLNESELISIIKRIIVETNISEDLEIIPYKIKPISGNLKVTNTKTGKSLIYTLEAPVFGFRTELYVNSIDSDSIEISVAGMKKNKPISKDRISSILKNNFGSKEIEYTTKTGDVIYFVLKP